MKIALSLPKDCKEKVDTLMDKIKAHSKKKITELIILGYSDIERKLKEWAISNKIKYNIMTPKWDDIEVEGATVRSKTDPKTGEEKQYNARAGFMRDEKVVSEVDILGWYGAPNDFRASILEKAKENNTTIVYLDE